MMQLYFAENLATSKVKLDKDESHHMVNVVRLHTGGAVSLTDGKGLLAHGIISKADPKGCIIEISSSKQEGTHRNYSLHIAIAPTRNIDRFEWFLEKATEIGIDLVTPLLCRKSERKIVNPERLNKMIVSAAKQSLKTVFPVLNPLTSFTDFILQHQEGMKFIAHCGLGKRISLKQGYERGNKFLILIGPEGDFDEEEIIKAGEAGFTAISLGEARLRTETAGVVACQNIAFMNE